jgi:phage-related protein
MATEEQKNNQQTLNDLLKDYINGQAEAAEYTALVTSRTADLTDAIRRTVRQKQVSTELDKQLVSSVKKLSTLSQALEKPYESVADIQKDILKNNKERIKLDNTIAALRNKAFGDEEKALKLLDDKLKKEKELQSLQSTSSDIEKQVAENYINTYKSSIEAHQKVQSLREDFSQDELTSLDDKVKRIEDIKQRQIIAEQEVFSSKEILREAETRNESAKLDLDIARQSGTQEEINKATEKLRLTQSDISAAKELQLEAEKYVNTLDKQLSSNENTLSKKEEELEAANKLEEETTKANEISKIRLQNESANVQNIVNLEKEVTQLQQQRVAMEKDEISFATAEMIIQGEKALEISKQNTQFLEEQEYRQKEIVKLQGLYNLSLGFAEGLLKKLGASGAAIALGLEEGKAAADEMARAIEAGEEKAGLLGGQLKVLGAGIMGTFKGMAKGIKQAFTALAFGALIGKLGGIITKTILSPLKGIFGEIKGQIDKGLSYLKTKFLSIQGFIDSFNVGEDLFFKLSQDVANVATNLGVGTKEAQALYTQARQVNREIGMLPEEVMILTSELNKSFGTTQKFSNDTVKTFGQLVNLYGLSNAEASEFVKISQLQGKTVADTALQYKSEIQALKARNNIAISEKEVMQEIAKSSVATQLTLRGQGKSLADAAFQAKRLGLEMDKVSSVSDSLLDFESSIAKEMEAELLIGRDLNLERARQAALQGDIATVAEEIAGQVGSAAEFGAMNVLQQQALADSVGVSRDELAKMLKTQELLADTGFDEMSDAQLEFNRLLKETGSEEKAIAALRSKGASEALTDQLRQVSAQEKEAQRQRDLVDAQYEMAMAMRPVAVAFRNILQTTENLRKVIIEKMQPFFNEFGSLVGEGEDAFEKMLNGPVGKLGEKLNDIGITLVKFFRNYGPDIQKVFGGVLDVFGSIYDFIGRIVTRLFDIQTEAGGTKGVFQSITQTLSKAADYISNIDVDGLITKVKAFIQNVKDAFNSLKDSPLAQLLSGDAGKISLAVAPLAFKATTMKGIFGGLFDRGNSKSRPMYVENVGAGTGDILEDIIGKVGGRKAGIGGGFRSGARGMLSYARDAFKGGRAGTVGRARLARAARGLVTGQGASFVGGTRAAGSAAQQTGGILKGVSNLFKGTGGLASTAGNAAKLVKGAAGGIGSLLGGLALDYASNKKKNEAAEKRAIAAQVTTEKERQQLLKEAQEAETKGKLASIGSSAATGAGIGAMVGSVVPVVGNVVGGAIGGAVGAGVGVVKEYGSEIKESIGNAWSFVSEKSSIIFEKLSERFSQLKDMIMPYIQPVLDIVGNLFGGLFDNISTFISDTFSNIKNLVVNTFENAFDFVINILDGDFSAAGENLKNIFIGPINFIRDQFISALNLVTGVIKNIGSFFKDSLSLAWNNIKSFGKKVFNFFKNTWKSITDSLAEFFEDPFGNLREGFTSFFDIIQETFGQAKDWIVGKFSGIGESLLSFFTPIKDAFFNIFDIEPPSWDGIKTSLLNTFTSVKDSIKQIFTDLGALIGNLFKTPINLAISGVNTVIDSLNQLEITIPDWLPGFGGKSWGFNLGNIQTVQDAASISHNGPFTIQDSKGNLAITHPNDKLVVSPNVSYVADGATGKGGPVFPVSEKFGALDVKVGKEGVLVQKVKDGVMASNNISETAINHINSAQYIQDGITGITELKEAEKAGMPIDYQPGANLVGVRGPFTKISEVPEQEIGSRTYKGSGLFNKIYKLSSEEKTLRKELQHEYAEEFRKAYSLSKRGINSTFAVEGIAPYTRTVDKFERIVSGLVKIENEAKSKGLPLLLHDVEAGYNDYGTTVQLGLTEGAGKVGYNESTRKNYVSMLLNTYVEPSKLFKNYTQPTPEPEVTESIIPERVVGQGGERITIRGTEGDTFVTYENGKVVDSSTLREQQQPDISVAFDGLTNAQYVPEQVEDGIGFWEVMSNPIGALKHYAVPAVVEGSGHLIEALYKTKVFSSLFKKALHKTPIVGQAMHAVTGALNINHLLQDEKISKDEIYQEVGKTALITMGGIAGGILGEVAMGTLGLATGPGAVVLGMLGGMAGAMLGEIVAESVADLVGARPVGKMIAGFMSLGHSDTHPTSEPTPNLAMVTPISSTIQKVSDGGALASRGPFTITDKFGATAVTAKGDGVVVSPNISYVNDGMVDVEPMNPVVTSSVQQSTTVIEQDNTDLKQELESMKQLMSELIKELPSIANRPIRVELDGNKVGESLGRITYRG